jgi:hypothetical protein
MTELLKRRATLQRRLETANGEYALQIEGDLAVIDRQLEQQVATPEEPTEFMGVLWAL